MAVGFAPIRSDSCAAPDPCTHSPKGDPGTKLSAIQFTLQLFIRFVECLGVLDHDGFWRCKSDPEDGMPPSAVRILLFRARPKRRSRRTGTSGELDVTVCGLHLDTKIAIYGVDPAQVR